MPTYEEMSDHELWAVYYQAQYELQDDSQRVEQRVVAARLHHVAAVLSGRGYLQESTSPLTKE